MQTSNRSLTKRKVLLLLLAILAGGSALRFYGLGRESLWTDELYSWKAGTYGSVKEVIDKSVLCEIHPPGFHLIMYGTQKVLGDSEWALRLPSAIGGVASILVIFLMGRRLFGNREGLFAAALMAVLYCPVRYSQEARVYSLLLLFSMLATMLWIELMHCLNKGGKLGKLQASGYVAAAVISCYLHYFGMYLVFLQALAGGLLFIRSRRTGLQIVLLYIPVLLLFAPWIGQLFYQLQHNRGTVWWIRPPHHNTFFEYLLFLFDGEDRKSGLPALVALSLVVLPGLLVLPRLLSKWRTKKPKNLRAVILSPEGILVAWLVVPFVGVFIESHLWAACLKYPYLIISLPAAYLLLSRAVLSLPVKGKIQNILAGALLVGALCNLFWRLDFYSVDHKEQVREAVQYVIEHDGKYPDSLVVASKWLGKSHWPYRSMYNYYFERAGSAKRVDLLGGLPEDVAHFQGELDKTKPRYIWMISIHMPPHEEFLKALEKDYECEQEAAFYFSNVWLFSRRPGS